MLFITPPKKVFPNKNLSLREGGIKQGTQFRIDFNDSTELSNLGDNIIEKKLIEEKGMI